MGKKQGITFLERLHGHCWICVDALIVTGCVAVTRMAFLQGEKISLFDYAAAFTTILAGGKVGQGAKNLMDRKGHK